MMAGSSAGRPRNISPKRAPATLRSWVTLPQITILGKSLLSRTAGLSSGTVLIKVETS